MEIRCRTPITKFILTESVQPFSGNALYLPGLSEVLPVLIPHFYYDGSLYRRRILAENMGMQAGIKRSRSPVSSYQLYTVHFW